MLPEGTRTVRWTHTDADGEWRRQVDGADGVIHLAGSTIGTRWNATVQREIRESRVLGTRHLVEAIAAAGKRPRALVSASAVGYYGIAPAGTLTEDAHAGTDFLASVCREWEAEALAARKLGVRVAIVRSGVVLHPREGALPRMLLPFRLFVGGPIGTGRQPFPWIHVDDEVELFLWALRNDHVEGPLNATAPEVVTNREFAQALGRALHRPAVLPTPTLAVKLVLAEGASIVTGGQWAVPRRTEELGYRFAHPRLGEALGSLLN
jgi:uncharacterized protein (TIGR01777 family)